MPVLASFLLFSIAQIRGRRFLLLYDYNELQYNCAKQKGCASCAASQQTSLFGVFFDGPCLLQSRHHGGDQNQLHDNARHGIE